MRPDRTGLGAWAALPFFRDGRADAVERALAAETRPVLPGPDGVYAAFALTQPEAVRVVILGQDPYPTRGHATGLAFSVPPGVALPRSLGNICREMEADIGVRPPDGDLTAWARSGVLLLNTVLTCPEGASNGHRGLGWQALAAEAVAHVSARPTAFVLWGRQAQAMKGHIRPGAHLIVESAHPSPLSAGRGFFGSRPFGRIDRWLAARGEPPVRWEGDRGRGPG